MKIITCASFFASGSSAVTDLLSEYADVSSLSDDEFRFLHDPDGVSDLEFNLLECHNRHNSGHALKRFMKMSEFNYHKMNSPYRKVFGKDYLKYTYEYINELTESSFKGWWFYDLYDKGFSKYHILQILNHLSKKIFSKTIMPNEITLCSHPSEEKFIECTERYTHSLFESVSDGSEYLIADQIVPSQNIQRVLRYFSDPVTVFVTTRDPRDVYCAQRFVYKDTLLPKKDPYEFCDWFEYSMESGNTKESDRKLSNVLSVRFEDMIYKYSSMKEKIEKTVGLDASLHKAPFSRFNPMRSVNNTQQWKKYKITKEIDIITKQLEQYLYDFDAVKNNVVEGIKTNDNKSF